MPRQDTAPPPRTDGPPAGRLIADRAYSELRDRIVTVRLLPGAGLREDELMRELGIGRTPLREAVKRLALENLVEVQPRRGTFVTDVAVADIVHVTEVRAELEGQAAQLAARRLAGAARAEAEAMLAEVQGLESDDRDALMRVDERLHRLLWEASGNPYLVWTLQSYYALALRVWHLVLARVPGLFAAVHDQRETLAAVLAGDEERARGLAREHVLAFQREIVEALGV